MKNFINAFVLLVIVTLTILTGITMYHQPELQCWKWLMIICIIFLWNWLDKVNENY